MNKEDFNKYCAEVMGYELEKRRELTTAKLIAKINNRIYWYSYNPYDDLNQMAEVFDKLMSTENFLLTKWFTYDSGMKRVDFPLKDVIRDFIISTMKNNLDSTNESK